MSRLFKLVEPWLHDSDSDDLIVLRDHLVWLQKELFDEYEPNRYESFDDRLGDWLENVADGDDRKWLFRILKHLFFLGKQQFDSLCRASYNDAVTRWIIDEVSMDICSTTLSIDLESHIQRTWFCPLTDSMRINSFLKLNQLRGHDHRPDWRSLEEFGDALRIRSYAINESIDRLVLLEDFVGSGNQMRSTVAWAAQALPQTPILVVPLVCCPEGVRTGRALATAFPNVKFAPTLTLRPELFLLPTPQIDEPEVFARVRDLILRIQTRLGEWVHEPFGYEATGALVALYSNCPDNTLPIIHHRGTDWSPLFSRIRRS